MRVSEFLQKSTPKRKKEPPPLNGFIFRSAAQENAGGGIFQYRIQYYKLQHIVRAKKSAALYKNTHFIHTKRIAAYKKTLKKVYILHTII